MTERKRVKMQVKNDLEVAASFIESLINGYLINGEGEHGRYSDREFSSQVSRAKTALDLAVAGFKGEISEVTG